ncbi:MAG: hypothetical protein KHW59_08700 [Clostridiales bacterium]|nr:hypothetical protein [Clostridiales bacterium]
MKKLQVLPSKDLTNVARLADAAGNAASGWLQSNLEQANNLLPALKKIAEKRNNIF